MSVPQPKYTGLYNNERRDDSMTRRLCLIMAVLSAFLLMLTAAAETAETPAAFDVEAYSLEELREIKTLVDERLAVLEREWAIEHGDRTVTFAEAEATVFTKKTVKQQPEITRVVEDAPEKTQLVWSTSDETIAKVSSDGTVTGVAKGDAEITATAKDNDAIFGSYTVHVVLPVTDVVAEEKDVTLLISDDPNEAEGDIKVTVEPADAFITDVTWTSSKEEIVTVDANGHIKGLAPGKATVTAQSAEEGSSKKATVNVTVVQAVSGITLSETDIVINKGKSEKLKGDVAPEDATTKKLEWTSSNEEIAKVSSDGTVSAKACGECDITCTATDGSGKTATCHVTVIQMVTSVKLSDSKLTLAHGATYEAIATIAPEDATNPSVIWSSSDESVATVDENGIIKADKAGDCEITCSATDGSEKLAVIKVHVPTFYFGETEINVDVKGGVTIIPEINGDYTITASGSSSNFNYKWKDNELFIEPLRAGSGTIKMSNPDVSADTITLKINIDHSACYDTTSYPKADYEKVLRDPDDYSGTNISIYGKVLQKSEGWGYTVLRVGTGGYGYYDKVFWVEYTDSAISSNIIEDDYVTVYGVCTGTHTYESIRGASITIPSLEAEKIIIGK